MSEHCERTWEWMSEWPSTYVSILGCFGPQCAQNNPSSLVWTTFLEIVARESLSHDPYNQSFVGVTFVLAPSTLSYLWGYDIGLTKKSVSWTVPWTMFTQEARIAVGSEVKNLHHLHHDGAHFIVGVYCCFIWAQSINNNRKCDSWYVRCLFYQVESILIHFQQLENFFSKNSHEIQHKSPRFCNV